MVEVHHLKEVWWALVEVWHTMRHHWMLIEASFHLLGHFRLEVAFTVWVMLMSVFFWCLFLNLLSGMLFQVRESTLFVLDLFTLSLFIIRTDVTNSRLSSCEALSLVSIKILFLFRKERGDSLLLLLNVIWSLKEKVFAVMWLWSCFVGDVN